MSAQLDFSALEKAILQLEQSLIYFRRDVVQQDPNFIVQMRAAAIQAFEYTYELSWKMLKRYLEATEPNPDEIESMSFQNLIRTGCERNLLLSDVEAWVNYRRERGITSHTYEEEKAIEVFNNIPAFLAEAKFLLKRLLESSKKS